ncbi:hypothetical protein L249_2041 [Ophiocordyceps polyrhachis-furcata BCC 54312]|uniref:DUF3955 domain-containing protein n=1 Tax=Ophiocordyceps polyrhachis-furcata BCC 54312 TaxID=1330021 RepID=A0A367LQZ6_9HYPO|nr:hypothetical protein L249_2041 [Ophiocordyceps polyrhachis-furcata BCC 54312]
MASLNFTETRDGLPAGSAPNTTSPQIPGQDVPTGTFPQQAVPMFTSQLELTNFCNDNPEVIPCSQLPGLYQYKIDVAPNVIFLFIFCVSLLWYGAVLFRTKRGLSFSLAMMAGLICEIMSYSGRLANAHNQWNLVAFVMEEIFIGLGPTFMAAGLYLCLGNIVAIFGADNSRIPQAYYTRIFIPGDMLALTFQAAGGAATAKNVLSGEPSETSNRVLIVGLVFQLMTLSGFIAASIDFAFRAHGRWKRLGEAAFTQHPAYVRLRSTKRFRGFIAALTLATACILWRSIFHLIELSEPIPGPIRGNQGLFIAFEGLLIVIAVLSLNIFNPVLFYQPVDRPAPVITHEVSDRSRVMALSEMPDQRLSRRLSDAAAADAAAALAPASRVLSPAETAAAAKEDRVRLLPGMGLTRRALGICLLLVTVFLWTITDVVMQFIFSDHTYDKPFFLVYINSSVFAFSLSPMATRYLLKNGLTGLRRDLVRLWRERQLAGTKPKTEAAADEEETVGERLLVEDEAAAEQEERPAPSTAAQKLGMRETAVLSLEFSMLWFAANYLASACLGFTSVASVTILTSTSSMWTLVLCAVYGVEHFSLRKLVGVTASMAGVVLVSTVDLSGSSDANRGSFPHKTAGQIAVGDAMALGSAVVYGLYVTVMKRRVGREDRVDMRLFFGLVGVFNLVLLWPLFPVLHWTGVETFAMPPTGNVWTVIAANSLSSFISDMCWAYAMLLTTPLVVTVGLSLTIPLSLIGEMIQYGQYSSWVYWIGAGIVLVSFVFINSESQEEGGEGKEMS